MSGRHLGEVLDPRLYLGFRCLRTHCLDEARLSSLKCAETEWLAVKAPLPTRPLPDSDACSPLCWLFKLGKRLFVYIGFIVIELSSHARGVP